MKKYYVYELINLYGTIEDVGETYRPEFRMNQHTRIKGHCHGKYYGRQDLIMNIVAEFDNRKDARKLETELKLSYGLQRTERDRDIKNLNNPPKITLVYKTDGTFVGEYESLNECVRKLELSLGNAYMVCSGKSKQTKGYIIKYKENAE